MDTPLRYDSVEAFKQYVQQLQASPEAKKKRVLVCCGTGCMAGGAKDVAEAFQTQLEAIDPAKRAELNLVMKRTGCHGFCEKGPLVVLMPQGLFYKNVKTKDVENIINESILGDGVIEKLLYVEPKDGKRVEKYGDIEFYAKQTRVAMRNIGFIDPANIDDYLLRGGY